MNLGGWYLQPRDVELGEPESQRATESPSFSFFSIEQLHSISIQSKSIAPLCCQTAPINALKVDDRMRCSGSSGDVRQDIEFCTELCVKLKALILLKCSLLIA